MKIAAILFVLCMFSSVAYAEGEGLKIWKGATTGEKYAFVLGCVSQSPQMCAHLAKQLVCEKGVNYGEFYDACMKSTVVSRATIKQIVDEMDKFYQNKNNKNAPLGKAFRAAEDAL